MQHSFIQLKISRVSTEQTAVFIEISTAASVSAERRYPFSSRNVVAATYAVRLFPPRKGCDLLISFIKAAAFSILLGYTSCPNTILFGDSTQRSSIPGLITTCLKPYFSARNLFTVSISSRVR